MYNKKEIMTRANAINQSENVGMSVALRRAWLEIKIKKIESDQFYLEMKDRWSNYDFDKNRKYNNRIWELKQQLKSVA